MPHRVIGTNQYNTLANCAVTTSGSYPPVKALWDNTWCQCFEVDLNVCSFQQRSAKVWELLDGFQNNDGL